MKFEVITLFPRMVSAPLEESILGKAQTRGLIEVRTRDLRPYGLGKHHVTDDIPYGGGAGMVMKPEPLVAAIEASRQDLPGARVVLLDPQGTPFTQEIARRLATMPALVFVCGRYEGVDERVRPFVDEEISLGDFILTGGELGAACIIDAVARLVPGVLGNEQSATTESFGDGWLEGPQYTRPPEFRGEGVPPVLLSGDHAKVKKWRRQQSLVRTWQRRRDLLGRAPLVREDEKLLDEGLREITMISRATEQKQGPAGAGPKE